MSKSTKVVVTDHHDQNHEYTVTAQDNQQIFSGTSDQGDLFVGVETKEVPPTLVKRTIIFARGTWNRVEFTDTEAE